MSKTGTNYSSDTSNVAQHANSYTGKCPRLRCRQLCQGPCAETVTNCPLNGISHQPTEVESYTALFERAKQHVSMYVGLRPP